MGHSARIVVTTARSQLRNREIAPPAPVRTPGRGCPAPPGARPHPPHGGLRSETARGQAPPFACQVPASRSRRDRV